MAADTLHEVLAGGKDVTAATLRVVLRAAAPRRDELPPPGAGLLQPDLQLPRVPPGRIPHLHPLVVDTLVGNVFIDLTPLFDGARGVSRPAGARADRRGYGLTPQLPSDHRLRRRVHFYETDMAGFVHFSCFFRYMEEAEHALWRDGRAHDRTPRRGVRLPAGLPPPRVPRPAPLRGRVRGVDPRGRDQRSGRSATAACSRAARHEDRHGQRTRSPA